MNTRNFSNKEFVQYLEKLAADFDESGSNATAEDYRSAADRITAHDEVLDDIVEYIKTRRELL